MAITGANDHIGSAGLTNRNRRSCGKILKTLGGEVRKIFGGQHLDETCRRINKFYNCCSQRAAHQFSF